MDAVDKAIKKKKHISDRWKDPSWESFHDGISQKQLFVFGVGNGLSSFLFDTTNHLEIEAIIDNDAGARLFDVAELVNLPDNVLVHKEKIMGADFLSNYPNDDIAVLITSLNHYDEIADQLESLGITHIYSYLCMEAAARLSNGTVYCHPDPAEQYEGVVQKSLENPIDPRKIVFEVSAYGETAKRVTKCLRDSCPNLDIVWIVSKYDDHPGEGIRCVHRNNWMRFIHEMETATIWAWETMVPAHIIKREGQTYIYLKHWSITLKNVGPNIVMAGEDWYDRENQVRNAEIMDYVFGSNRFDRESFRASYGACNVVDIGSPKADILFDLDTNRTNVRNYFGLNEKTKIAIYAPTFRWKLDGRESFDVTAERIVIDYNRLKGAIENRFGGTWRLFVRLHPSVAAQSKKLSIPKFVTDASKYRSAEELVSAADIIITDYSSVMFEASYLMKPVFIYATDIKEYVERERDLLMDLTDLPFPIAQSDIELEANIMEYDEKAYQDSLRSFLRDLGVHEDGHSGERAAEFIKDLIEERSEER